MVRPKTKGSHCSCCGEETNHYQHLNCCFCYCSRFPHRAAFTSCSHFAAVAATRLPTLLHRYCMQPKAACLLKCTPARCLPAILAQQLQANAIGPPKPCLHRVLPPAAAHARTRCIVLLQHLAMCLPAFVIALQPALCASRCKVCRIWHCNHTPSKSGYCCNIYRIVQVEIYARQM